VGRHGPDLGGVAAVQPAALKLLSAQPWPGNVRQLENAVKRMLLVAHGYAITEDLARAALLQGPLFGAAAETAGRTLVALCEEALANARSKPGSGAITTMLTAVEHELLAQAHASTSGNITQMAQLLGWSRLTVREKLTVHGLRPKLNGEVGAEEKDGGNIQS
jgi:DNA-binding NtrC family response regulator